jgi:hypothetical protein
MSKFPKMDPQLYILGYEHRLNLSFKNLAIWIFTVFQKSDKIWARKFAMQKSKLYKPKSYFSI